MRLSVNNQKTPLEHTRTIIVLEFMAYLIHLRHNPLVYLKEFVSRWRFNLKGAYSAGKNKDLHLAENLIVKRRHPLGK